MKENEFVFPKKAIPVVIFEKILVDLGISKQKYCEMRGKSHSWFYNSLRSRGILNHQDIKVLLSGGSGVTSGEFTALCLKYGVEF